MMSVSGPDCIYYKPINDDKEFGKENEGNLIYLISETGDRVSEGVPAQGISTLFQGRIIRHFWIQEIYQTEHVL
jgi:hypothetical protein